MLTSHGMHVKNKVENVSPTKKAKKDLATATLKKTKYYKQKFKNSWLNEEFRPWLTRSPVDPESPYCIFCEKRLVGGICHIKRHSNSSYHKKHEGQFMSKCDDDVCIQNQEHDISTEAIQNPSATCVSQSVHQYVDATQQLPQHIEMHQVEIPHLEPNISTTMKISGLESSSLVSSHISSGCETHHMEITTADAKVLTDIREKHQLQLADVQPQHNTSNRVVVAAAAAMNTNSKNEGYMVEFDAVGSSTEVTVPCSNASCGNLPTIMPESSHITVTIQGHDPMYIQSAAGPVLAYASSQVQQDVQDPLMSHIKEEVKFCPSHKIKKKSSFCKTRVTSSKGVTQAKPTIANTVTPTNACNGSTSGMSSDLKRTRKWYRQKYSSHWECSVELNDWLTHAPSDHSIAYCLACSKKLKGGVAHLRRHAQTPYHRKRMAETYQKRQLHLAQQVEVRLTGFGHRHGLSADAIAEIPALLLAVFPDSPLCKLLCVDRMQAMMLVRKDIQFCAYSGTHESKPSSAKNPLLFDNNSTAFRSPNVHFIEKLDGISKTLNESQSEQQQLPDNVQKCSPKLYNHSHHQQQQGQELSECNQQQNVEQYNALHPSHIKQCHGLQPVQLQCHAPVSQSMSSLPSHFSSPQEVFHISNNAQHPQMTYAPPQNPHSEKQPQQEHSSLLTEGQQLHSSGSACSSHSVSCSQPSLDSDLNTTNGNTFDSVNTIVAVPSPSQFETLPPSGITGGSSSVVVHQADTSNSEAPHSYALTGYDGHHQALQQSAAVQRWHGRVALVTGASSGIGAAVCRSLVKLGMTVVGVARQHDRIKALAEELSDEAGSLTALHCDLSRDEEVHHVFRHVLESYGPVHLCVNNAGFSANHSLLDGTPEEWRAMLDVNVVGLCLLTKLTVQAMSQAGIDDGHIIHISSMSGHRMVSNPNTHFYAATKHAVRALAEGLRLELRAAHSHIRVTSISPGLVATEFSANMTNDPVVAAELYASIDCLKAEDVAASVLHAITAPPHVEINDILMRPTEQSS